MAKLEELKTSDCFIIGAKFEDSLDTLCRKCGELKSACICRALPIIKEKDSYFLGINEEKSGGKDITSCGIFYASKEEMQALLKLAKKHFASGGNLEEKRGGFLLILQGKHKEPLRAFLKEQKFKFKK